MNWSLKTDTWDRPRYEVADIIHEYLEDYLETHNLSSSQRLALTCIMNCRTSELGAHKLKCNECGYEQIEYNSCRNRHCPKCQGSKRMKWVQNRLEELLPIPYYHCVFTLPHSLNPLTLYNKRLIYDLFFQAASYTIHTFSKDPKYLGARAGFIGILHSWGQNLSYHVHLHFIIAGGGISHDAKEWIGLPYRGDFLFPVKAMSRVIRQKFRELLHRAYQDNKLVLDGDIGELKERAVFKKFLHKVSWQNWVIYIKKPFSSVEEVVKYIGRYTHRVAISNQRIIDIADGQVAFRYKIYRDNTVRHAILRLSATEFIHRFLLHILPDGFKKIRYFGFLSNGIRRSSIALIRELLDGVAESLRDAKTLISEWIDEVLRCPQCGAGELIYDEVCALPLLKPG